MPSAYAAAAMSEDAPESNSESDGFYSYRVLEAEEGEDPVVEYLDAYGHNVTPRPLHVPEEVVTKELKIDGPKDRKKKPPKHNTVMRTFLHVTTALYSMAGLGSLEQSKVFKEQLRASESYEGEIIDLDKARAAADSVPEQELKLDVEEEGETGATTPSLKPTVMMAVEADDGVPDNLKAKSAAFIDIVLVESDTIWTLDIPGTCVEVIEEASKPKEQGEKDEDKKEDGGENEEAKKEEKEKPAEDSNSKFLHLLEEHSRYELVSSSSQTLDFSKKKKGTQCDDIDVENIGTQVSMKHFLEEERRRTRLLAQQQAQASMSSGMPSPRSPTPTSLASPRRSFD